MLPLVNYVSSKNVRKGNGLMAGGNFDGDLLIVKGEINPTGTLGDFANRGMVHLHFWVIQMKAGRVGAFMQAQGMLQADPTMWKTRPPPDIIHRHGMFEPGQAFATAVAMLDPDNEMDWWSATIDLHA
jgi:hypothetical protein